ncbi:MAG: ABC transporter ATP-binding protein [bacterium]|nr:ABC transporter ATP-binding protein [bacterium]MCP5066889.1 ABC transporter ATP-binding protein [bacterium]
MLTHSTRTPVNTDRQILERYTDQPISMPRAVRQAIEDGWGGDPVQLYALADLDGSLKLTESWVALGPRHVAIARAVSGELEVQTFAREAIHAMRLDPGLTCNTLRFLGEPGQPALARVRFTHRQRRAMESLQFLVERALEGSPAELSADADGEYVDSVAGPIREAQALVAGNDLAVVWRLLGYLQPYRGKVIFGMASAAVLTALSLVPPYLTGFLVDEVIRPVQDGVKTLAEVEQVAWTAVGAIAGSYFLRQLAAWARLRWMAVLGEHVARDLRTELYEHLQKLSLSFYSRKKTGSLITRVTADTDRLWEFLALGIVDVSLSLVMLVGLSAVLIHLDWKLGLIMTLPVPFLCLWVYIHGHRMNRLFLRAWRKWSALTDIVSDTVPGMKVVKAFHQEGREKQRFGARNHNVTDEFNRIHEVWTSFWPALMLAVRGMVVLVWVFALPRVLPGDSGLEATLTSGTFIAFLLYMTMFIQPIEIIGQMARIMNRATSSAHRIFEVLDTEPQVVDKGRPVRLEPLEGKVEFQNVTFGYDGVRQVVQGISFAVESGEMVGLVGPSGGGKTTVTNLLARFYDVTGGCVLIDGIDVRQLETGSFRRQLGMVLQDPYLFHGTVMENIRYGSPEASVDDVVEAATTANAHDFLCKLPSGYETMVGERGQTLSGGERQRISIARAILHDPRILVLDEATSSVDTETEFKIQEALERLTSGRTVFAIAHRLSTLRRADRIFVIEDGRLTESGTPTELLEKPDGTFRHLWQLQQQLQGQENE